MTRRLASTASAIGFTPASSSTSSSVPDASPKPQPPSRWDDTQHPMNSHPNFKAYSQAQTINGIPPPPVASSTLYTPSTIPGTPAPLTLWLANNCQLPSAHTMVSVGGILTKIPSRVVRRTVPEAPNTSLSTSTTSPVPNASPKAASPYWWDDDQHPMHSHPNFKTYRQAAMINGINPSTVGYTPRTIPGTPAPIHPQPEGAQAHTIISIGGILTKIPLRVTKMAEAEAQAPTLNVPIKSQPYPMRMMPITPPVIDLGIPTAEETDTAPSSGTENLTAVNRWAVKDRVAAAATATITFPPTCNGSEGERSELKWESGEERRKKGKEDECWSGDDEDWVGLQTGLPTESKNAPLASRTKTEAEPMRRRYENSEAAIGLQSGRKRGNL